MIKQKCTRLERCEVNLQHKKYRGIWLAGVKFFERDEPREELLEYSTFYAVVHCLVICLVHFVVRRNTIQYVIVWSTDSSVRLLERFKIIGGYLKQVLCCVWVGSPSFTVVVVPVVNRGYLWMKLNGIMIIHDSREDKKQLELVMFKYFAHILTFRYSDSLFSDLHDGSDAVFRLDRPDGQVASFQVLLIAT